ncbi:MAG: M20/M25/M40 family metallo-hydrolase [Chromatiales bacterium]|nr:MAG: M20/M25/M40 family metallo-hydrolase [Chromatiales bacterium]
MMKKRFERTCCCAAIPTKNRLAKTRRLWLAGLLTGAVLGLANVAVAEPARYDLVVSLQPGNSRLAVQAIVDLPAEQAGQTVDFLLTSRLEISESKPRVSKVDTDDDTVFQGINGSSSELTRRAGVTRYRVQVPPDSTRLELTYAGRIDFALETQGEEYTRGFRETPGVIGEDGVYLAGSTLWYPYFNTDLVSFNLNARAPAGWHLISQGDGTSTGSDGIANWDSAGLVDEIYLVGGPLTRYEAPAGAAVAEVYLREDDAALAGKYLDATARYIEMYRRLIGPYPYGKFALVENFWETGYGMPSFTLLGPQIIRFPFILTSSYPHEILHNWWGNSVFVDYDTGNWCEGLTAYMADHLLKEQLGQGAEYRRDTLKKYRDFVKDDKDFPLSEFRSRHSAATEAVGYGKTLMGFHMLRQRVGDDDFRQALQSFYRKNRGTKASFADVRAALESTSGIDLERFFVDWVTRTGAADLDVADITVTSRGGKYTVTGRLLQRQAAGPFELQVPLVVTTADGAEVEILPTTTASTSFEIATGAEPLMLSIDPRFDVFRLLDVRETAPSIGQIFGDGAVTAVLPADADDATRAAYEALVRGWESPVQSVDVVLDTNVTTLPADRAVWLLGASNRIAAKLFKDDPVARVLQNDDTLSLGGEGVTFAGHSTVAVTRHPNNVAKAVGWITADPAAAFEGLGRKLPHYGKYSYLAFEGDEPANIIKGEWTATDSPLLVDLRPAGSSTKPVAPAALPKPAALAELPSLYSRERMLETVTWLAAPERDGRGVGTQGLADSAQYLAEAFANVGLEPAGDNGTYLQGFRSDTGPDGKPHELQNIVGYIPGGDPRFDGQAIVISAHYDHLGFGWPDERAQAGPGAVYFGADDNASGVAVLLELARAYKKGPRPPRTLVFLAVSGEEAGLLGSAYYVQNPRPVPVGGIRAVINMDTVGRLGDQPVQVLGAESATEWPPVFRGVGFTTGIPIKVVPGATASSDQQSFINVGVAGVQIFTGAHGDYHRPTDTIDRVDVDGMVRVATVVREAATYLTEREDPLTVTGAGVSNTTADQTRASAAGNRRRVSFGTVPDFAWQGPGIRVESVVAGSPAETAGIQAGDVITAIDDEPISDLGGFSEILKGYSPGDSITAAGERNGEAFEVDMELVAR